MPIRLNLLHEIEQARTARRRDPLKISLYILGGIVFGFAAMYFWQLGKAGLLDRRLAARKADFEAIEPKAKVAKEREQSLQKVFTRKDALVRKIDERFYWAPMLAEIARQVPREVQITKLTGDVTGEAPKKVEISLDGTSAGDDPRKVAEELRQSLTEAFGQKFKNVEARFRSLEDGEEKAALDGKQLSTAIFGINVTFQSGEEAPATPAPRRKK
ncbi:MAG: hypothetical protein ABI680_04170 [Chthoniobacteraceae bacterium]